MKTLGLDIGTTTLCALVAEDHHVLASRVAENRCCLPATNAWEKLQDPIAIYDAAEALVSDLLNAFPDIEAIGLTGQQHGILYLDASGRPAGPLITWQDERGNLAYDPVSEESYATRMSCVTGYSLASGYGTVTHWYNVRNGLVPKEAVVFCTIADYVGIRLSGKTTPLLNASNAASFGAFNISRNCFDGPAIEKLGVGKFPLPQITNEVLLGYTENEIPVSVAIGDNQASYLGATGGMEKSCLINIGTGSQVSLLTNAPTLYPGLDTRPFLKGGYLVVGAALCGGRAYALLENLFRQTVHMVTGKEISCYEAMQELLKNQLQPTDCPKMRTTFAGTREDASQRATIHDLDIFNMTPLHLIYATMYGIAEELFELYERYLSCEGGRPEIMFGAGNALRKNPVLCRIISETFGNELHLSNVEEEAAFDEALWACECIREQRGYGAKDVSNFEK
jgi:sedoheptulokinase